MKLFQINEDDLEALERLLPEIQESLMSCPEQINRPCVRDGLKMVKEIISNVRWNYGPPERVERIPNDDGRTQAEC